VSLANPILLWSLLGLSVPVAIHLLSRKEGKVIKLGSIRYVHETSTQQFKGIKLNELLLLALRCALILIFCVLLSGLRCTGISNEKWAIVEADLEKNPNLKSVLDSLRKEGYEQHQLRDGFSSTGDDSASRPNYWALAERLGQRNLASAVVLSSNKFENFKGKRILLPPNIKWMAIPVDETNFHAAVIKLNSDSVYVRTGHTGADQTFFTSEKTKFAPKFVSASSPDSVSIVIAADDNYRYDRSLLFASLTAIQKNFPIKMEIRESRSTTALLEKCDWIFWLSDSKPSDKKSRGIIMMRPNSSANLFEQVGQRDWLLTKRLDVGVSLDRNLTIELARLIIPSEQQQEIARTNDKRVMPESMAWSSGIQSVSADIVTSNPDRFLIVCLFVLLLIERLVAHQRNQ